MNGAWRHGTYPEEFVTGAHQQIRPAASTRSWSRASVQFPLWEATRRYRTQRTMADMSAAARGPLPLARRLVRRSLTRGAFRGLGL